MKTVVALDSFKGSLTAVEACKAVADGILAARPEIDVVVKPMADGGEGTAAALLAALPGGVWIEREASGPLPDRMVRAGFAWFAAEKLAVVEMATASGLTLLAENERDPTRTSTYGTGELLAAAAAMGARRILLTIGGSATNDGGIGAAAALGWRFLDAAGDAVTSDGGHLLEIATIVPPSQRFAPEVSVLCDVTNPLCGANGAAMTFAPQKGATPQQVEQLDAGLRNLARHVSAQIGRDILDIAGGGAAGGLGAGAVAFLNARLQSGIDTIVEVSGLRQSLHGASWCITGEGCFDETSLQGKVVSGVKAAAAAAGARLAVFAGSVRLAPEVWRAAGISDACALLADGMTVAEAMQRAPQLLFETARRWAESVFFN